MNKIKIKENEDFIFEMIFFEEIYEEEKNKIIKLQEKIEFKIFICVKIMNIKILIFNFINYLIFL